MPSTVANFERVQRRYTLTFPAESFSRNYIFVALSNGSFKFFVRCSILEIQPSKVYTRNFELATRTRRQNDRLGERILPGFFQIFNAIHWPARPVFVWQYKFETGANPRAHARNISTDTPKT